MSIIIPGARAISPKEKAEIERREFHGDDYYNAMLRNFEELRQFRNEVSKRRPTDAERAMLEINKESERHLRFMLWGSAT